MKINRQPTNPGTVLKELYLEPRGIQINQFAQAVGYSTTQIRRIIHGYSRIEASLAVRRARVLDTSPEIWINLQNKVDLYKAQKETKNWSPKETYPAKAS